MFQAKHCCRVVPQIGGVPITSFDQLMVDSDVDTVKSHIIREKLRAALGSLAGATDDVETLEDDDDGNDEEEGNYFSSDDNDRFNTVIDTRKLQRLLNGQMSKCTCSAVSTHVKRTAKRITLC